MVEEVKELNPKTPKPQNPYELMLKLASIIVNASDIVDATVNH